MSSGLKDEVFIKDKAKDKDKDKAKCV